MKIGDFARRDCWLRLPMRNWIAPVAVIVAVEYLVALIVGTAGAALIYLAVSRLINRKNKHRIAMPDKF